MILTTYAQRNLYLQMDIKNIDDIKFVFNTKTNDKIIDTLELYYYVYDENHTPYNEPKTDIDCYVVTLKDDTTLPLEKYLERSGQYSNYYAVISNHNKITSIEHFKVNNHDNFYSIQINSDLVEFLNIVGLDNVKVNEHLDNYYLPTINLINGYELLFFLTTSNNIIYEELNRLKYEIISTNLKQIINNKINQGLLFVLEDNSLVHLTYTLKDRLEIEKSIKLKLNTLVNNGKAYLVTENDLKTINDKLKLNEINYNVYLRNVLRDDLQFWSDWKDWGDMQ